MLQVILNVIEHDMNIAEAVATARFHSQWLPDEIMVEPETISDLTKQELESRGHTLVPYKWGRIGSANGIQINDGIYFSGADPRHENAVVGY